MFRNKLNAVLSSRFFAPITIVFLVLFVYGLTALLSPVFSFIRWDNFEHLTAFIIESQRQLISGQIPFWNHYNSMGEMLLGNGQSGVFYLPNTLVYVSLLLLHLPLDNIPLCLAIFHSIIMALGIYYFCRMQKLPLLLSMSAAIAVIGMGYIQIGYQVWGIFSAHFALTPWAFLSIHQLLTDNKSPKWPILFAISLIMMCSLGHGQFLLYFFVLLSIYSVGLTITLKPKWIILTKTAGISIASLFISSPTLLPVYETMKQSVRSVPMSINEFLELGIPAFTLVGAWFPLFKTPYNVFTNGFSYVTFANVWPIVLIGASCIGFLVSFIYKKKEHTLQPDNTDHRPFFILFTVALVSLLFSLGKDGFIYPLTYGIPVWSSMRWPHKFLPYSMIWWPVLAVLAWSLWLRTRFWIRFIAITVVVLIIILSSILSVNTYGISDIQLKVWAWLLFGGSLISIIALYSLEQKSFRLLLLIGTVLTTIGSMILAQSIDLRRYPEKIGTSRYWQSHLDSHYRLLPLSSYSNLQEPEAMQEYDIFESATYNQLMSATGIGHAMLPKVYLDAMPIDFWGLLPDSSRIPFVKSRFADHCAIRYVVVGKADTAVNKSISSNKRFHLLFGTPVSFIYERVGAFPIVSIAQSVYPYSPEEFNSYATDTSGSSDECAFVTGVQNRSQCATGDITNFELEPNKVRFNANVKGDSCFVIVSQTYTPQWRAWVNGVPTKVYLTNKSMQGVFLSKGNNTVVMKFVSDVMPIAVVLFFVGLILLIIIFSMARVRARII